MILFSEYLLLLLVSFALDSLQKTYTLRGANKSSKPTDEPQKYNWKFTKIECKINPKYFENLTCEIKPKRNHMGILDLSIDYVSPRYNIWMLGKLFYKVRTEYKKFYVDIEIDICAILRGDGPPLLRVYLELALLFVAQIYPQYIHKCPYHGHYEALNLDLQVFVDRYPHVFPDIVPAGDYMMVGEYYDKVKGNHEYLGITKLYLTVSRSRQSKSATPLDFMNLKWAPFQIFGAKFKILDEKVENYTSLLQLPQGTKFDWMA